MSNWNKVFAIMALSALFSAPALADGTKNKTVNRGPAPLQAKVLTPPREGCRLTEDGKHWACPAPVRKTTHAHAPKRKVTTKTVHRKPAKTTRRVVRTSAPAPRGLTLDISGFSGGVGNGVDGGYYGGGGAIILGGGRSFSGVTQHAASRITFRSKHRGGKGGGYGGKKGGGCGC